MRSVRYTLPVKVTLTPRGEELLRDAIRRNPDRSAGQIVEQALAQQLTRQPTMSSTLPPGKHLSSEEWEAALDRMAQFSDKIPSLPGEAFTRDSLYRDHN